VERLREVRADIHIVVAYGQIMPGPVIDLPPRRSLNVHFSLLPKYRGASPVAWAIRNGETMTGITIFRLNEKMDEGDILASAEALIRPDDTTGSLEARLAVLGADLLIETLERIDSIVPQAQNHALATAAPKLKKEFGLVDWSRDAAAVDRHVRAMNPWPTAYTFLRGERFILLAGRPAVSADAREAAIPPGTVRESGPAGIRIVCGGGSGYLLTRLQTEGKKPLEAAAFLRGGKIVPGDRLGAAR
jgi:methionyl-tRNA formyltransferase